MRTSRAGTAGIVIAAIGGAVVACVMTLSTLAFLQPDVWPLSGTEESNASDRFALGGVALDGAAVVGASGVEQDSDSIERLQRALDAADGERRQLSESLVALNREVVELEESVRLLEAADAEALAQSDVTSTDDEASAEELPGEAFLPGAQTQPENDNRRASQEERLLAAGVDPFTASRLQQRQNEWQLARLELIDRAAREGWGDSDRLESELDAFDGSRPDLRAELGDDAYDRYLSESGRRNRVGIRTVIPGSAADTAGIQAGDLVISYANNRLFSPGDLRDQTQGGVLGETVTVVVERNGSTQTLNVARGPLGVTLSRERSDP